MDGTAVSFNSSFDPYVYQAALTLIGDSVTVQTTHGSVRGVLINALPDHLVVESASTPFYIRIQQIVWIFPG
ncbi:MULTISPECIES: YuzF family protein [Bacillaceae]|uniref:DUF2642 domain-containing protein n=1 Tax=Bacillus infantis TaxID=324767 RepID=A0A5D4ST74_9BACI|nr:MULTISPECIES: YuzF family protein [Bacillus]OXT15912.1 hypothetical protein B9K06_18250 [Bacillus sp. OG2]MCA1036850.1 YuzF family protein [Bacillus infantis]MCK6206948.1 YuzF family protein [Bacillus infantis]MCP1158352.1 YuzF family protein [Bacillus infantis]MDW2878437.1 YuzF family protein [Bacillus infantis]